MSEYYLIARIISAKGSRGFVKINSISDFPDRYFDLKHVFVDFHGNMKSLDIDEVKVDGKSILLKFARFDSADEVEILIGKDLFVDTENLVELPEGFYFIHDLIGSEVYRNDEKLGVITDVLSLPANDVYVIEKIDGSEFLFPALAKLIKKFDKAGKILVLEPGEDIYEEDED